MQSWLPIVVLVAAIGLTYLFCIRPMRRSRCGRVAGTAGNQTDDPGAPRPR